MKFAAPAKLKPAVSVTATASVSPLLPPLSSQSHLCGQCGSRLASVQVSGEIDDSDALLGLQMV